MYLLDTNVISETRRTKPHGGVMDWLGTTKNSELHLSAFQQPRYRQASNLPDHKTRNVLKN